MDPTSFCLSALIGVVGLAVAVGLIAIAFLPRQDGRITIVHSMALRHLEEYFKQNK